MRYSIRSLLLLMLFAGTSPLWFSILRETPAEIYERIFLLAPFFAVIAVSVFMAIAHFPKND